MSTAIVAVTPTMHKSTASMMYDVVKKAAKEKAEAEKKRRLAARKTITDSALRPWHVFSASLPAFLCRCQPTSGNTLFQ